MFDRVASLGGGPALSNEHFVEAAVALGGTPDGWGRFRVLEGMPTAPQVDLSRVGALDRANAEDCRSIAQFVAVCSEPNLDEADRVMDELDLAILALVDWRSSRNGACTACRGCMPRTSMTSASSRGRTVEVRGWVPPRGVTTGSSDSLSASSSASAVESEADQEEVDPRALVLQNSAIDVAVPTDNAVMASITGGTCSLPWVLTTWRLER